MEEKDAGFTYYRLAPALHEDGDGTRSGPRSSSSSSEAAAEPAVRADEARLQEVLRLRKENFDTHGAPTRATRGSSCPAAAGPPGRGRWACCCRRSSRRPRLRRGLPDDRSGALGVAGDRGRSIRRGARARAKGWRRRRRVSNVVWKRGELEKLPMRDDAVDVALLSQALHHAHDPARAVEEAARITGAGGRVLVLDLRSHGEEWVRAKLGDRRLGFRDEELAGC